MTDVVSVVMPAYNAGDMINTTIQSVLNQTYPHFELIIVDDASTDNTRDVVNKYSDERIKLITHEENRGVGATRDTAIAHSKGDWVAVLDADDAWSDDRLEKLISMEPSITGNYLLLDNIMRCYEKNDAMQPWKPLWKYGCSFMGGEIQELQHYLKLPRLLIKPLIPRKAIVDNAVSHSALRFSEDTEFFIKLIKKANLKLKVFPEPLYYYRLTPGSLSSLPERSILMKDMFLQLLSEYDFSEKERAALTERIRVLDRNIEYIPFLQALQKGSYLSAFGIGLSKPSRFLEFFRRLPDSIPYRVFLMFKGGRAR